MSMKHEMCTKYHNLHFTKQLDSCSSVTPLYLFHALERQSGGKTKKFSVQEN